LDIDMFNTLHGDVIDVCSSSSGSYELSLFSSKVDSAHGASRGVALGGSSSASIDDHWSEANATSENFRVKGNLANRNRGHLEASSSRRLSSSRNKAKGKEPRHESSSPGRAPHHTPASQQAPRWGSASKNNHNCSSAKAKAKKVLLDSEVGTSEDLPPRIRNSFLKGCYSPSIGMDISEWQIILD
jgi:hypothetical protein